MGGLPVPLGDSIPTVTEPNTIDWKNELEAVQKTLQYLTPEQQLIADYWGTGYTTMQWNPIIDRLIDTYTVFGRQFHRYPLQHQRQHAFLP